MDNQQTKLPVWFWILSAVLLLWNLMGLGAYIAQITMTAETISALPENEAALYTDFPLWANIAFAIAVIAGTLGCIGLLLRKKWAKQVLMISMLGVIIQMFYNFFISKSMEVYGPGQVVMPILILVIAICLVLFAEHSTKKGWLN